MNRYEAPIVRLRLDSLEVPGADPDRSYSFVSDPMSGKAELVWGKNGHKLTGGSALQNLQTTENMDSHSASVVMGVGEMGSVLEGLVECQDTLLIEMFGADGRWHTAFDGFVGAISSSRTTTSRGISWHFEMAAEGLQRMLSQQWFNWFAQVSPEASQSFRAFGQGSAFYKAVQTLGNSVSAKQLINLILEHAIGTYLDFKVRGAKAGLIKPGSNVDGLFQCGSTAAEWETPFDLFLMEAASWYTSLNGPLMSILSGLNEPDACEFFLSYRPIDGMASKRDVPTWIFRSKPWPWWSPKDGNDTGHPETKMWDALPLLRLGGQFGPGATSIRATKHDAGRTNAWVYSIASASDVSAQDLMGKFQRGVWSDDVSIKRYGFSMRQVTLQSYLPTSNGGDPGPTWDKVVAMCAGQEAPLPRLTSQHRSYPLIVGAHVGSVVEDWTGGAPTTGYLTGVSHSIQAGTGSFNATTSLSISRCLPGSTRADYAETIKSKVPIRLRRFKMSPLDETTAATAPSGMRSHNQPNQRWAFDPRLIVNRKHVLNYPSGTDEFSKNLCWLTAGLREVERVLGKSVVVTSGLRSYDYNALVGGTNESLHLKGLAFDFQTATSGKSVDQSVVDDYKALLASGLKFEEFYLERQGGKIWLHFGTCPPSNSAKQWKMKKTAGY